jgi:hypothetical protein
MDMGYSTRLQRRFMWWFFSLSIIPVVILTGYFTWSQSQLLITQAHQQLENERDRYYFTIKEYFMIRYVPLLTLQTPTWRSVVVGASMAFRMRSPN